MEIIQYYLEHPLLIRQGLKAAGIEAFGGIHAPYVLLKTPNKMGSWEFFDLLLNKVNVVGTPGAGFGPHGEIYFRLSAFGFRENVIEAIARIQKLTF